MWGNLAGRLGANDLNSTLQKIGNAVAPPPGEDGYDDDYEEDYDEDYDDYEDEEGDYDDGGGRGGFGFVGLIARALDDNKQSDEAEVGNLLDGEIEGDNNDGTLLYSNSALSHGTIGENDREGTFGHIATLPKNNKVAEDSGKGIGAVISTNDEGYMKSESASVPFESKTTVADGPSKLIGKPAIAIPKSPTSGQDTVSKRAGGNMVIPAAGSIEKASHQIPKTSKSELHISAPTKPSTQILKGGVHGNKSGNDVPNGESDRNQTTRAMEDERGPGKYTNLLPQKRAPSKNEGMIPPSTYMVTDAAIDNSMNQQSQVTAPGSSSRANRGKVEMSMKALPQKMAPTKNEGLIASSTYPDSSSEANRSKVEKSTEVLPQKQAPPKNEGLVSSTYMVTDAATRKSVNQQSQVNAPDSSSKANRSKVPEPTSVQLGTVPNEKKNDGLAVENKRILEELRKAREQIAQLEEKAGEGKKLVNSTKEELFVAFQEKEARLLQATTEEHNQEIMRIEQERQLEIHSLNEQNAKIRTQLVTQQAKYKAIIEESETRAERVEANFVASQKSHESQLAQHERREERSIRSAEDKVAHTLALLDERNEQVTDLKKMVRDLESKMTKHQEGEEEAEAEADELQDHVDELEHECEEMKLRVAQLEEEAEKYSGMQMELTVVREERDRLKMQNQTTVESAMQSNTRIETERDEAISELRDVKVRLKASMADLDIARADVDRMTMANSNLSDALEAFQDERRAELELLEQQRAEAEKALESSHNAAIKALRDAHNQELEKIQDVSDTAVRHKMDELSALETQIDRLKSENTQMRRSLDEAIYRLQTSQEDVIDRTLMKNILLDWCTMKDKVKRQQVLELMANVLHFNEDERDKVHLTHMDIESVRSRVVGAIAAPLPPSKADVDALEGTNVREKFLSFMLAETDEGY